jgi:hypothetical protein
MQRLDFTNINVSVFVTSIVENQEHDLIEVKSLKITAA